MSKKLTPLEALESIIESFFDKDSKDIKTVRKALKENEKLKECYKNELKNSAYYNNLALKYKRELETIRKWLSQLEYVVETDNYNEYLDTDDNHPNDNMSEEEYELLKEILK